MHIPCRSFSCRQLDENEEWLDVDFQIDCNSDSYSSFYGIAVVGVCVYPIGVPTVTMLLLMKNGGDIKKGGPGRERYEFLVADCK